MQTNQKHKNEQSNIYQPTVRNTILKPVWLENGVIRKNVNNINDVAMTVTKRTQMATGKKKDGIEQTHNNSALSKRTLTMFERKT